MEMANVSRLSLMRIQSFPNSAIKVQFKSDIFYLFSDSVENRYKLWHVKTEVFGYYSLFSVSDFNAYAKHPDFFNDFLSCIARSYA